jgi:hypothetical protein
VEKTSWLTSPKIETFVHIEATKDREQTLSEINPFSLFDIEKQLIEKARNSNLNPFKNRRLLVLPLTGCARTLKETFWFQSSENSSEGS